jgi:hypothetical protein
VTIFMAPSRAPTQKTAVVVSAILMKSRILASCTLYHNFLHSTGFALFAVRPFKLYTHRRSCNRT